MNYKVGDLIQYQGSYATIQVKHQGFSMIHYIDDPAFITFLVFDSEFDQIFSRPKYFDEL